MATSAAVADEKSEKRAKTGGRPAKKSLDAMIADAERRGRLAALPDDTTVEAELAAFFLIISMSQLRELRKEALPSEEDKKAARIEKAAEAAAKAAGRTRKKPDDSDAKPKGLRMIKISEKDAVGTNQPVTYKMGDLKEFQRQHSGYGTFEVRLASAGLLGFVSEAVPFFASPKPDRKGRTILQCAGWGMDQAGRENLVASTLAGKTRCVWLTPAEALHSLWSSEKEHKRFAKPWLALLKEEIGAAKSAIDRTALHSVALEGKPSKQKA
ncbi:hypothetical protein [Acidovorax soli]|uniref:Uncharacterized protein n=1 Tax=Acidovorax soli TaxID=592050 RepID=A0A1H4B6F1_9BURK|nr:hypothetical protein [Acidovorax soli]SEA43710.1 hypothetical protein SAMN05421875_1139 [Acidovorax soli]